jgi:hypothetical protein
MAVVAGTNAATVLLRPSSAVLAPAFAGGKKKVHFLLHPVAVIVETSVSLSASDPFCKRAVGIGKRKVAFL